MFAGGVSVILLVIGGYQLIEFSDSLPKTSSGKVARRLLV
jgi:acyl-coenzyme A synthetase/AMP-(fatty) acid ligase